MQNNARSSAVQNHIQHKGELLFMERNELGKSQGRIKDARGPWHISVCLTPTPTPEVRVCATNIFTGSDVVAATIFRFVNGRCHHYTSSTCVTFCLSSEIDITPRV